MKSSYITNSAVRTRHLYLLEQRELQFRDENEDIDVDAARYLVKRAWQRYNVARPQPIVKFGPQPIAWGYSHIELGVQNHSVVTTIHEITHARGYGFLNQFHSTGFVKAYFETLSWWFRWDFEELLLLAKDYRLL